MATTSPTPVLTDDHLEQAAEHLKARTCDVEPLRSDDDYNRATRWDRCDEAHS